MQPLESGRGLIPILVTLQWVVFNAFNKKMRVISKWYNNEEFRYKSSKKV
jgi:hypothetical protein